MKKKLTEKDKKDWNNFLQSKSKVFNKDVIGKESLDYAIKLKTIDLHGYSLENANKTIKEFIKNCSKNNVIKINVITGKGLRSNIMNDPYIYHNIGTGLRLLLCTKCSSVRPAPLKLRLVNREFSIGQFLPFQHVRTQKMCELL